MIPIQDLLNRIRWDEQFGKGRFEIGYYDRVYDAIIKVPFTELIFSKEDHFAFQLVNNFDERISIPFHRVRQVWKDGLIIWERKKTSENLL